MNIAYAENSSIKGGLIKEVDNFKYLGTYLAIGCSLKLELEERLKCTHQAVRIL